MATYAITNAPQLSNLNDFRTVVGKDRDFSKSTRFAVQIGRLSGVFSDLIYLCETAELPGRAFSLQDYRYYGPNFKLPTFSEYADITFSFLVRDVMREKETFDNWMAYINPKNTYDFRFLNEYSSDIYIYQFSEIANAGERGKASATYKATLRRAYPINVQSMPLSWVDENIHRLQVTFTFTDWLTDPEGQINSDVISQISPFTRTG
jgi:hypothetical protein